MKRDHQPMAAKPTALDKAAVPKLELELDENATHVHRIPKDLINRMREREVDPAPPAATPAAAPAPVESAAFGSLAGVAEDRTAVFRPPPELLARAKRMRPPAKPNANEAPTKPPPPLEGEEAPAAMTSVPAAPKVPFTGSPLAAPVPSAPRAEKAPLAARSLPTPPPMVPMQPAPMQVAPAVRRSVPGSVPAPDPAAPLEAGAIEAGWDDAEPSITTAARASSPSQASAPPAFSPMEVGTPTTVFHLDPSVFEPDEASSGVIPVGGTSAPLLAPPVWETTGELPAESVPPTTTAPVVRSEQSERPEPRSPLARNLLVFAIGLIVIAALALWKSRH